METNRVFVRKADGELEPFEPRKLELSLIRSGAHKDAIKKILDHVMAELQDDMSTSNIYRHAFTLLKKIDHRSVAARYSMRRAVFSLGPSGFPFEDYVAEIFKARGYAVASEKIVIGKCAIHEVDLIASKGDECIGAEIKFHNTTGTKTDLKVALYVKERFADIMRGTQDPKKPHYINKGMLITNTKFTKHVISYAKCADLALLSWNYPLHGNLEDFINQTGVYPVTALTSLTQNEKNYLLSRKVVLCGGLEQKLEQLHNAGVDKKKLATVLEESQALCRPARGIE